MPGLIESATVGTVLQRMGSLLLDGIIVVLDLRKEFKRHALGRDAEGRTAEGACGRVSILARSEAYCSFFFVNAISFKFCLPARNDFLLYSPTYITDSYNYSPGRNDIRFTFWDSRPVL